MNEILEKYIPSASIPIISLWFKETQAHLTIKKPRLSKYGDFRPAYRNLPHRISVNGDLNPYHFLITLTHEFAHVFTWIKYKNSVKPHGDEWKSIYSRMLTQLIKQECFPKELITVLNQHINSPTASSCTDSTLFAALKKHDLKQSLLLMDLTVGDTFYFRKRHFIKGKKRRTRYECIDQSNSKTYLINGQANVDLA